MDRSMLYYVMTVPFLLYLVIYIGMMCAVFRMGLKIVLHRMYLLAWICVVVLPGPVMYVGYFGPQETVPWNNRLQFLAVSFIVLLCSYLGAAAGCIPGEHPSEPRTSITQPVHRAVIQSLRLTDSLTDFSFIRELLEEVRC